MSTLKMIKNNLISLFEKNEIIYEGNTLLICFLKKDGGGLTGFGLSLLPHNKDNSKNQKEHNKNTNDQTDDIWVVSWITGRTGRTGRTDDHKKVI